jgi:hypothetical protein
MSERSAIGSRWGWGTVRAASTADACPVALGADASVPADELEDGVIDGSLKGFSLGALTGVVVDGVASAAAELFLAVDGSSAPFELADAHSCFILSSWSCVPSSP